MPPAHERGDGWRPGARWAREGRQSLPSMQLQKAVGETPLVTSIREGSKILIAAVSPAARAIGLAPGMAATQARAQVPGLDIRPADPEGDLADLNRLAITAARRWSPIVALSGADGLFIDITGAAHLFGGEARMARRIVRLLARLGVTARIAVADTAGAAWALARHVHARRHPRESGGPASSPRPGQRDPRFRGDDEPE